MSDRTDGPDKFEGALAQAERALREVRRRLHALWGEISRLAAREHDLRAHRERAAALADTRAARREEELRTLAGRAAELERREHQLRRTYEENRENSRRALRERELRATDLAATTSARGQSGDDLLAEIAVLARKLDHLSTERDPVVRDLERRGHELTQSVTTSRIRRQALEAELQATVGRLRELESGHLSADQQQARLAELEAGHRQLQAAHLEQADEARKLRELNESLASLAHGPVHPDIDLKSQPWQNSRELE